MGTNIPRDEPLLAEQPGDVGLAWPAVDPAVAVNMLLYEAELLMLPAMAAPVTDESLVRDLSPLGR